ncbi:hypothetical protein APHAL10511_000321 [Amanita phalloides]|nr:hypothetical protein APHAL10511_000321 [Amanita phalloides]
MVSLPPPLPRLDDENGLAWRLNIINLKGIFKDTYMKEKCGNGKRMLLKQFPNLIRIHSESFFLRIGGSKDERNSNLTIDSATEPYLALR